MNTVAETPEVLPSWRDILREQGRTMTWLASRTGRAHSTVQAYAYGRLTPPPEWLRRVSDLLGVRVR